jgi:hypothetical protein
MTELERREERQEYRYERREERRYDHRRDLREDEPPGMPALGTNPSGAERQ